MNGRSRNVAENGCSTLSGQLVADQRYTSEKGNRSRLWGYLLRVDQVLDEWPEPERRRKWMTIDEAEIALPEKRRVKFGRIWTNAVKYFVDHNLYRPKSSGHGSGA